MPTFFWIAGENSGDLHASYVMKELGQYGYNHIGIGGYQMQRMGLKPLFPFNKFNVMGFLEVIKHLRFFSKVEKTIKEYFIKNKPDILILVDYPGLNLRIAKYASELGIPVFYYICPQFWAWKHHRVKQLADYTGKVACILPFEPDLLHIHQVDAEYVGHPIVEEVDIKVDRNKFAEMIHLDTNKKWLSFFPGSRFDEVSKLLPIFLNTIKQLDYKEYEFLISRAPTIKEKDFMDILNRNYKETDQLKIIVSNNYEMMKHSDFCVVKSGTASLEAAYIGTPFLLCYKANPISYWIARKIVKIKYIGLPNILLNRLIIPELIQGDVSPRILKEKIHSILANEAQYQSIKENLSAIRDLLGKKSASKETASLIIDFLNRKS
ncbi:MAG TPA: lipid-A-disaccharide synthase [Candidatus Cloacimonadota bacterium]|nr:lipid-A-disaccharide synthase [Candidatus Cloacimonadota bacterium]HOQ80431.1 lipid-A-disaccharide synthase [Candidatus Cloacimonadota bacterium]